MAEGNDPSIQFPSLYISYPTFNSCMFTIMQGVASTDGKFLNFVHLVFFFDVIEYSTRLSSLQSLLAWFYSVLLLSLFYYEL